MKGFVTIAARTVLMAALFPAIAGAQTITAQTEPPPAPTTPAWGRISFYGNTSSSAQDGGPGNSFSELIGNLTFESPSGENVSYEYRADVRFAGYPNSTDRGRRVSIYDGYVGVRFADGNMGIRAGQMWLNDLGGLGALGGGLFEYRQRKPARGGRWRASLFGGLEPRILDLGYISNVIKVGGLLAYEGEGARRHVVGFVHLRDNGVTERSVLVFTNFLPVNKQIFIYQAAEYDLRNPAVSGSGSLTYFFTNGRYAPTDRLEIQATFHRGRSIDTRSIVQDQLDGRPIDPKTLDGLRFESMSGRVTVRVLKNVRVFGGYGQDRNNREDAVSNRITYGLFASNVGNVGLDVTASDSRINRGSSGSYDSWYVSAGRSLGSHIYLSGDFGSSLSVFRFTGSDGFVIETRPRTRRLAFSGVFNLNRGTSLLATVERVYDSGSTETRLLSGISYRF